MTHPTLQSLASAAHLLAHRHRTRLVLTWHASQHPAARALGKSQHVAVMCDLRIDNNMAEVFPSQILQ